MWTRGGRERGREGERESGLVAKRISARQLIRVHISANPHVPGLVAKRISARQLIRVHISANPHVRTYILCANEYRRAGLAIACIL